MVAIPSWFGRPRKATAEERYEAQQRGVIDAALKRYGDERDRLRWSWPTAVLLALAISQLTASSDAAAWVALGWAVRGMLRQIWASGSAAPGMLEADARWEIMCAIGRPRPVPKVETEGENAP